MGCGVKVLVIAVLSFLAAPSLAAKKYNITVGYLPCLTGEVREREGLTISGAISLALEELNNRTDLLPDVDVLLEWHNTNCDNVTSTDLLIDMSSKGVVAFFGPEQRCQTEAIIAESKNLPMISYKCSDYQPSTLTNFVRLDPSGAQTSKSVISLLRYYRWHKFSLMYEEPWETMAFALKKYATKNNMTLNHRMLIPDDFKCCEEQAECCKPNYLYQVIKNTKDKTRIYVFLGSIQRLVDMMMAMEAHELFSKGEYMVIFVDTLAYSPKESMKYLMRIEDRYENHVCPNTGTFKKKALSLLTVVTSEPSSSYEDFVNKVRTYNTLKPFNFPDVKYQKYVSIYAAYLYDSVQLYAKALDEIIKEDTASKNLTYTQLLNIARNGSRIVNRMIKGSPYKSISGKSIRLNELGESEGDYSVLGFKPSIKYHDAEVNCCCSMIPVGYFQHSSREFPEYKVNPRLPIDWPDSIKPEDEPPCGFSNEICQKNNSEITYFSFFSIFISFLNINLF